MIAKLESTFAGVIHRVFPDGKHPIFPAQFDGKNNRWANRYDPKNVHYWENRAAQLGQLAQERTEEYRDWLKDLPPSQQHGVIEMLSCFPANGSETVVAVETVFDLFDYYSSDPDSADSIYARQRDEFFNHRLGYRVRVGGETLLAVYDRLHSILQATPGYSVHGLVKTYLETAARNCPPECLGIFTTHPLTTALGLSVTLRPPKNTLPGKNLITIF